MHAYSAGINHLLHPGVQEVGGTRQPCVWAGTEVGVCLVEQRFGASQGEHSNSEPFQGLAQHSILFGLHIFSLQILSVIKGHIGGVFASLWWRLTPLWPLNIDFQPRLSAASWHSAALPSSPLSLLRAAESPLAVPEWGNICSLARARGGSCVSGSDAGAARRSRANGAARSGAAKARALLAPLAAGVASIRRSKATLGAKPRAVRAAASLCGGEAAHRHLAQGWGLWLSPHHQHLPSR